MPLFMDVHGHIEGPTKHEPTPQSAPKVRKEQGMKNHHGPKIQTMRRILFLACPMTHAMAFTVSTVQHANRKAD